MQNVQSLSSKNYHNYSNINFYQMSSKPNSVQNNFRSMSQVGKMMTDLAQQKAQSKTIYHYKNTINQVEKEFEFPQTEDPKFEKHNISYEQFYNKNKKFVKPYTQCTKYADNLMKNRQLLRRGQFDLPTQPVLLNGSSLKNTSSIQTVNKIQNAQLLKVKTFVKKSTQQAKMKTRKQSSDQKNGFDKSLKQHVMTYQTFMKKQRGNHKDNIKFQNSMNRILAAEMINHRLLSMVSNNNPSISDYKPHSVRLEKRFDS